MKISIDDYVQQLLPWEFIVTVGGKDYATRPPTFGDVGILMELTKLKDTSSPAELQAGINSLSQVIASLFEGEKPDMSGWGLEMYLVILGELLNCFTEFTKKKLQASSAKMEASGTSGK